MIQTGDGSVIRERADIEKELGELRAMVRSQDQQIESLNHELQERMSDARENAQEIDRLRACLRATNALLEFYLPEKKR